MLFLVVMGVFNVVMAAMMFDQRRRAFGPRLAGTRRERRLLSEGVPGRAFVMSYGRRDLLGSEPEFDLVLRVELAGLASYVIKKPTECRVRRSSPPAPSCPSSSTPPTRTT